MMRIGYIIPYGLAGNASGGRGTASNARIASGVETQDIASLWGQTRGSMSRRDNTLLTDDLRLRTRADVAIKVPNETTLGTVGQVPSRWYLLMVRVSADRKLRCACNGYTHLTTAEAQFDRTRIREETRRNQDTKKYAFKLK